MSWQRLIPVILAICSLGVYAAPPIVDAARHGDHDTIRSLIAKKADLNSAEGDGSTALLWASYRDDLESADLLIHAGANVNAANDLGGTPLWAACQNGSSAMVKKLLDAHANANAALLLGETPLMVASRGGYPDVVQLLIAKDANVNAHAARGQTALMWAVAEKHPDVVAVLLAHGVNINAKSDVYKEVMAVPPHGRLEYNRAVPHGGETALMFAARIGDLASMKLLVAAGANINDQDAWGVSATTLAAHSGFADMVDFLLEKGADPNAAPSGFTALQEAILRRNEHVVAALLDHGADPNAPLKSWTPTRRSSKDWNFEPALVGATPYWLAARFNQPNVMRLLVKHGADPLALHQSDYYASARGGHRTELTTPLMAAVGMGGGGTAWVQAPRSQREALTLDAVKQAVDAGVDVNAINTDGRTALDAAKALHYESVVKFLAEKGAKAGKGGPAPKAVEASDGDVADKN